MMHVTASKRPTTAAGSGERARSGFIEFAMLRQAQPEPPKLQKLLFHFWIVLSIGLPRTVHRLLVKLADLLIEIVQRGHLLTFRHLSVTRRTSIPEIHVRDVKCGPEGFARRNASPMQGDQGAAVDRAPQRIRYVGILLPAAGRSWANGSVLQVGQPRQFRDVDISSQMQVSMSALPPKADIAERNWHVRLCQKLT